MHDASFECMVQSLLLWSIHNCFVREQCMVSLLTYQHTNTPSYHFFRQNYYIFYFHSFQTLLENQGQSLFKFFRVKVNGCLKGISLEFFFFFFYEKRKKPLIFFTNFFIFSIKIVSKRSKNSFVKKFLKSIC